MCTRYEVFKKVRSRGQRCGDIELASYLANEAGPVPLLLDLRIAHDRFGSSSDPSINGHLHYLNDIERSLNEAAVGGSSYIRGIQTSAVRVSPLWRREHQRQCMGTLATATDMATGDSQQAIQRAQAEEVKNEIFADERLLCIGVRC